jgi:hypothetical protein
VALRGWHCAGDTAQVDFATCVEQAAAIGSERFVSEFLRRLQGYDSTL